MYRIPYTRKHISQHSGHALVRGRFLVRYFYICELFAFAFIYLLRTIRIRWAETYHDLDAIIFY
jgi:hypothetical protein